MTNIWVKGTARFALRACCNHEIKPIPIRQSFSEAARGSILEDEQKTVEELGIFQTGTTFRTDNIGLGERKRDIFRELLAIDDTPDGVLQFVNQYGLLTAGKSQPLQEFYLVKRQMMQVLKVSQARGLKMVAEILGSQEFASGKLRFQTRKGAKPEMRFYLDHLWGFLWLEVFRAIEAGVTVAKCEVCKRYFLHGSAMGPDPKCCSRACTQKKHRDANRDEINRARREARAARRGFVKIDARH